MERVPTPLRADFYTISSNLFASEDARAFSSYNFTNRISPSVAWPDVAKDDRMVFYGLSHFIKSYLSTPVTKEDVIESEQFLKDAGIFGSVPFDKDLWMSVVEDHNGFLPISIKALLEGRTFFPNEPVINVTASDGYGELAAHIEAELVGTVSCATARVTLCRHWLNRLREEVKLDLDEDQNIIDNVARYLIHDFGYRASSVGEEAILLGMAHLLVFHGTDTVPAAYMARKQFCENKTGKSVIALAHRLVQGHNTEKSSFEAIHKTSKTCGGAASYVSDCYNYHNALDTLEDMAKNNPESVFIARPDSGNYKQNVKDVLDKNLDNLRYINGDSMNPKKVKEILEYCRDHKPTLKGVFGVGGYLRNTPNRDSLSSAYKLDYVRDRSVMKLSEERSKMSIPGRTVLVDNEYTHSPRVYLSDLAKHDMRVVYYSNGYVYNDINFSHKQNYCINEFDNWQKVMDILPDFGECTLSPEILELQYKELLKYK